MKLLQYLQESKLKKKKHLAVLIDPDYFGDDKLENILLNCKKANVSFILVGGSFLSQNQTNEVILWLKSKSDIPIIIFPGNCFQVSPYADAILFMSLISGRNPDFLIGQQVLAAPLLEKMNLEILPTGYLLIENDILTTAHYISNTLPLPRNKPNLAYATVLAGKYLGLKLMYLDTGSGASNPVPIEMIEKLSQIPDIPIFVGGGIKEPIEVHQLWKAGADVVVVGTAIEKNPDFLNFFKELH